MKKHLQLIRPFREARKIFALCLALFLSAGSAWAQTTVTEGALLAAKDALVVTDGIQTFFDIAEEVLGITMDYICNPQNLKLHLEKRAAEIDAADAILVFSCGVGVQTVADNYPDKKVFAACDRILVRWH